MECRLPTPFPLHYRKSHWRVLFLSWIGIGYVLVLISSYWDNGSCDSHTLYLLLAMRWLFDSTKLVWKLVWKLVCMPALKNPTWGIEGPSSLDWRISTLAKRYSFRRQMVIMTFLHNIVLVIQQLTNACSSLTCENHIQMQAQVDTEVSLSFQHI